MAHRTLQECIEDLQRGGHLVTIEDPINAELEAAEIQRRVYRSGGPAILFRNVKGCSFPMVSNLFGTIERARYLFRDTLERVQRLIELKTDPGQLLRHPWKYRTAPWTALHMLPQRRRRGPVLQHETKLHTLPQLKSWPDDGGAFITLGQVYSENVEQPGLLHSNLGMYRIQISGGKYEPDREVGLHYQIHRGIGVHHEAALRQQQPFRVNIFLGGSPAMTLAAVMPLPEGMSELTFAGALSGRRIRMVSQGSALPIYADADFCITGTVDPKRQLPEGPFGDHLGYYSLAHDFPVLQVDRVYHRPGAVWPFTVVGRPPQEDTVFGELIHELTGPVIPSVVPGVHAVHAVDAAGVHPLMLAIGSERYTPHAPLEQPQELLTQAHAILGQGQMSLAKYLLMLNRHDIPDLRINDIADFLTQWLRRVDWRRDLHFHTCTTMDTLDYSSGTLNQGSKLVIPAVGPEKRALPTELPANLQLPPGFTEPRVCCPGVLAINAPARHTSTTDGTVLATFCQSFGVADSINRMPLIVLCDDSNFTSHSLENFLWVTFTRSDPAVDTAGIGSFVQDKHWGCDGSLVIDARIKPHHAPPLIEDPATTRKVDALATRGLAISRYL